MRINNETEIGHEDTLDSVISSVFQLNGTFHFKVGGFQFYRQCIVFIMAGSKPFFYFRTILRDMKNWIHINLVFQTLFFNMCLNPCCDARRLCEKFRTFKISITWIVGWT